MAEQPGLSFAGLLRQLRAGARLTQEELAHLAGVSPRSVSDLERGVNRTARKDTAVRLADALRLAGPARELFVAAARGRAPAAEMLAAARGVAPGTFAAAAGSLPRVTAGLTGCQAELAQLRAAVTDSPYRGLSAFEEHDAALFFGRETAAAHVLERMSRQLDGGGLLVVSGVSGAGKSSLLRAGVLPRIREGGLAPAPGLRSWPCLVFTPARAPLDELALRVALLAGADAAAVQRGLDADPAGFALTARQAARALPSGPGGNPEGLSAGRDQRPQEPRLLLVVDQFEELFTLCADEGQRRAFITALHAAASARHGPDQAPAALVVLGLRADFEARCAGYPQLARAIQDRYLVTSMTARQLRMAITEPAKTAGARVDDDLTDVLLTEVGTGQRGACGAGMLPLLSHALDQAWRCRAGEALTLGDYERTGGIEGAVAASAQRAYDHLTPAQQAAARQVFTRLTATSSDGVDAADRATRAELADGKSAAEARDVEAVLEAFTAERLLTLAAGTVEISHEVLLTAWPLLRDNWLADTHADRIVRTRLHNVAAEWARHSRDPSYLYSGSLLQAAAETAARVDAAPARHPALSRTERDFLDDSDRAHRRRARRRQAVIAFLIALVTGFASAAVLAVRASQQAAHQRDIAVSGQLISQSEIVGETSPAISTLLSIAAWRINPSSDARYAMQAAAARPGIAVLTGHASSVTSVAFSPDGTTLATGSNDGTVRLWDVATRRQIATALTGHTGPVFSVVFSPDGTTLATGSNDGTVRLWNVATCRQIGNLSTGFDAVLSVAFSPHSSTLASGSANGTVRLWNVATRRQIGGPLTGHANGITSVAFSPDGQTLASGGADDTVRLWNVATRRQIGGPLTGHTGAVTSVAFSPDGQTLASGSFDDTVRLWNVATRRQISGPLTGHANGITSVAFSPDGQTLASGGADATVRMWNVATRSQIGGPRTGHTGAVTSVAFSPDGQTLASGSYDQTARLWNVAAPRQIGSPPGSPPGRDPDSSVAFGPDGKALASDGITSVAFSPDGKTLVSGSYDQTARLWNVAIPRQAGRPFTGHSGAVLSVAFSPHGGTLASGGNDGTVRLWDVATHRQVGGPLTGYSDGVMSVAFSPDGTTLASGGSDGTARLWNVATRRQIGTPLTGATSAVDAVAFSPDGGTLAGGGDDGTVRLWDVATRRLVGSLFPGRHSGGVLSVAFSPHGDILATSEGDGTIRLWNMATRHQVGGPLTGHAGAVSSVAFSPDGTTLAGGDDRTARLWNLATHHEIGGPLSGGTSSVSSVAFSPDGKTLAIGNADGTARLWDVANVADLLPHLCTLAGRSLTRAEWARYMPQGPAYQKVCP